MIGVCMWPPPAIFLGRRTDFATNAVATLLAGGRFGRMAVALVASLLPPASKQAKRFAAKVPSSSNFGHRTRDSDALYVQSYAPLWLLVQTPDILRRRK